MEETKTTIVIVVIVVIIVLAILCGIIALGSYAISKAIALFYEMNEKDDRTNV